MIGETRAGFASGGCPMRVYCVSHLRPIAELGMCCQTPRWRVTSEGGRERLLCDHCKDLFTYRCRFPVHVAAYEPDPVDWGLVATIVVFGTISLALLLWGLL